MFKLRLVVLLILSTCFFLAARIAAEAQAVSVWNDEYVSCTALSKNAKFFDKSRSKNGRSITAGTKIMLKGANGIEWWRAWINLRAFGVSFARTKERELEQFDLGPLSCTLNSAVFVVKGCSQNATKTILGCKQVCYAARGEHAYPCGSGTAMIAKTAAPRDDPKQ